MEDQHEDDVHYMSMALKVAKAALAVGEVPVGCILVLKDRSEALVISHGANQVNATRDATRHAEIVAIDRLLTGGSSSDHLWLDFGTGMKQEVRGTELQFHRKDGQEHWQDQWVNIAGEADCWENKLGWRNNSEQEFKSPEVLKKCELYVTCEPCIMCGESIAVHACCTGKANSILTTQR